MPINPQVLGAGLGLLSDFAGAGMGMLMQGVNDRRQLKQQHKLMQMQMHGMKQMGQFNYDQQMRMWHETNIGPQMELLKEAGLNPGLFYKGAGAGGTTQAMGAPGIGGANAPVGGMEIMNMMMAKAQTELIRAQTEKTKAETGNVPLEGKNIEAQTASLTQGVENAKAQKELMEIELSIKQVEDYIKGKTQNAAVGLIFKELAMAEEQLGILENEGHISDATKIDKISIVRGEMLGIYLRNSLTKAQTVKTYKDVEVSEQQIRSLAHGIAQRWRELEINGDRVNNEERRVEHENWVNDIQKSTQLPIDLIEKGIQAIFLKEIISPGKKEPIRGFHQR